VTDPLLARTAAHATAYLDGVGKQPVGATATATELRDRLARPLADDGVPPAEVVDDLVRDVDGGLIGSSGPRFFGWVIGGTLPAALAADWLVSTWDQNACIYATSPASAVVEEVAGAWLLDLLGLPADASVAFVTGTQLAHVTALAVARSHLLAERGHDVELCGLHGAPPVRVLAGAQHHSSLDRAVRLLGIGLDALEQAPADAVGRIDPAGLAATLDDRPAVVCLAAGDLNAGAFDDSEACIDAARARGAWVHVDGAFGLWAAASPKLRHLTAGAARADSWATDAHKWLNVPYDCGLVATAHPARHRATMAMAASYMPQDADRMSMDWNPEWSRRARATPVYAAIRSLGRNGIAALVERCSEHCTRLVSGIGALDGAEVVVAPTINQGLVRFGDDARTDAATDALRAEGTAWFGNATWNGRRVMRVSVTGWNTTAADVDRTIATVRRVLATTR
jgi:glutamate/tyrosine decarboxylase-like PLP-dependent enzyme